MDKREKQRWYNIKRKFGITKEQYQQLYRRQKGKCYVCQHHSREFPRALAVDHNHKTGEIRGLLCTYCNRYRVGRHTDPEIMRRVYLYLKKGTGWFVPKRKRRKKRTK